MSLCRSTPASRDFLPSCTATVESPFQPNCCDESARNFLRSPRARPVTSGLSQPNPATIPIHTLSQLEQSTLLRPRDISPKHHKCSSVRRPADRSSSHLPSQAPVILQPDIRKRAARHHFMIS